MVHKLILKENINSLSILKLGYKNIVKVQSMTKGFIQRRKTIMLKKM